LHHLVRSMLNCSLLRRRGMGFGYRRDERGRLELDTRVASLIGLVILVLALSIGNWLLRTAV
jgi:hypothetical protein